MSKHLLSASAIRQLPEIRNQHQFNEQAVRHSRNLTAQTGMQRIGLHLVRVEPGHDSTTHHYHTADEEFIYVIAGRGQARIGNETFDIGVGDFMGFGAPSPAHSIHNPHHEDLVYLMGGERWATDVVQYPELRRCMIKAEGQRLWTDWDSLHELPPR